MADPSGRGVDHAIPHAVVAPSPMADAGRNATGYRATHGGRLAIGRHHASPDPDRADCHRRASCRCCVGHHDHPSRHRRRHEGDSDGPGCRRDGRPAAQTRERHSSRACPSPMPRQQPLAPQGFSDSCATPVRISRRFAPTQPFSTAAPRWLCRGCHVEYRQDVNSRYMPWLGHKSRLRDRGNLRYRWRLRYWWHPIPVRNRRCLRDGRRRRGSNGVGIGNTLCARERGESHRRRGYACHDQPLDVDLLDVHAESFPNRLSWAVFRIGSDSQFTRHQPTYAFFARTAGLQARSRPGPGPKQRVIAGSRCPRTRTHTGWIRGPASASPSAPSSRTAPAAAVPYGWRRGAPDEKAGNANLWVGRDGAGRCCGARPSMSARPGIPCGLSSFRFCVTELA
ncbi:hypothetical protein MM2B1231_1377 [Mycobacteroides abscessus subsp. bolletii 2B-1231]|nr:hypothetical protein MM2B0626_1314 [Mycobacteroides abscessus subsp. bolletii 2B-0626]EIV14951.1 hypothetical protein MM2B0912R_1716 [Mycobacteroides abscessus subsp. bolletii 2B-0912-R]EIV25931.1 hypothetical protein MM2B0912S_1318 [Mycobacteroides abscessus subsp. bolletii 2B-0912-S]EIV79705.1 hypothetical protein MM2B1231_1377 [Mycobacteroides abscessus subsp. bolletii 2B-1231]EIV81258.1 hypothetical protein MM2B0107_0652 [Mycobacteroides abscessus subsp. bolletii 2B-0107]